VGFCLDSHVLIKEIGFFDYIVITFKHLVELILLLQLLHPVHVTGLCLVTYKWGVGIKTPWGFQLSRQR
jgi:hypothetical protein